MGEERELSNGGTEYWLSDIGNSPLLGVGELKVGEKSKTEGVKNRILVSNMYCAPPEDEDFFLKKKVQIYEGNISGDKIISWFKDDKCDILLVLKEPRNKHLLA